MGELDDSESGVPNPPVPLSKAVIVLPDDGTMLRNEDGTFEGAQALRHCKGVIHVFEKIPGNCQCGNEYWEG